MHTGIQEELLKQRGTQNLLITLNLANQLVKESLLLQKELVRIIKITIT
jgi:hypothetical protein